MKKCLKIIVLGAGSMGQNHIRLLSHSKICLLAGIVDSNQALAESMGRAYGIPAFTSLKAALSSVNFQGAVIATPTETHYKTGKCLLSAGKHILIEKPITPKATQGRELLTLAQSKSLVLMGGHVERFNPAIIMLRQKLKNLGIVYHMESERTGPFPERIFSVGVSIDLLAHDVDLILSLTGLKPKWAFSHQERRVHPKCEDGITSILGFNNNIIAVLKANWLSPTKTRRFRIYGNKGMFEVDFLNRSLYFHENQVSQPVEDSFGLIGMEEGNQIKFKTTPSEPLAGELEYFIHLIQKGKMDVEMARTNLQTIEVIEKIQLSARRGQKVTIK